MKYTVRYTLARVAAVTLIAVTPTGCTRGIPSEDARLVLSQALPALDGAHLEMSLVEVRYGPGGRSAPHRHPCVVIGYVIEGALRTQVLGGPVQVYRAGESFYEAPDGVHQVSANASDREPVRFLATFVCDHPTPHTLPAPPPSTEQP